MSLGGAATRQRITSYSFVIFSRLCQNWEILLKSCEKRRQSAPLIAVGQADAPWKCLHGDESLRLQPTNRQNVAQRPASDHLHHRLFPNQFCRVSLYWLCGSVPLICERDQNAGLFHIKAFSAKRLRLLAAMLSARKWRGEGSHFAADDVVLER